MKIHNKNRKSCPICESSKVQTLYKNKETPVYFGCTSDKTEPLFCTQTFMHCSECSCIFIQELIDPETLYTHNHNVDIVGSTWKEHYNLFYSFVSHRAESNCSVLEIGDPSAKLAKRSTTDDRYKSWTIVEPSIDIGEFDSEKISFINDWVENVDFSHIEYDFIVMSHVFEHLHGPKEIFDLLHSRAKPDTKIFLSVPNLENILNNKKLSPAGLHFEHTFYYDEEMLEVFFKRTGWHIKRIEPYVDHSYFLELAKGDLVRNNFKIKRSNIDNFIATIDIMKKNVDKINEKIKNTKYPVYLFGGHVQSQIMLTNGISEGDITAILDNATHKHGKRLYGTNLQVFKPSDVLARGGECIVICHMGQYTEEIKEQILEINPRVQFI